MEIDAGSQGLKRLLALSRLWADPSTTSPGYGSGSGGGFPRVSVQSDPGVWGWVPFCPNLLKLRRNWTGHASLEDEGLNPQKKQGKDSQGTWDNTAAGGGGEYGGHHNLEIGIGVSGLILGRPFNPPPQQPITTQQHPPPLQKNTEIEIETVLGQPDRQSL